MTGFVVPKEAEIGGSEAPVATPQQPFVVPTEAAVPEGEAAPPIKRGNLDPELDKQARQEARALAQRRFDQNDGSLKSMLNPLNSYPDVDLSVDSAGMGIVQKLAGLAEAEMLGGRGREYGEAFYQYFLDEAEKRAEMPGVSKFLGAMVTPDPTKKSGLVWDAATGGFMAGAEELARQTPSEASVGDAAQSAGIGATVSGAFSSILRGLGFGADEPAKALNQKDIKGQQIQEVAGQARKSLDLPDNTAVAGADFARTARGEVDSLNRKARGNISQGVKNDQFKIGEIATAVRTDDSAEQVLAGLRKDLGEDKFMEVTNTVDEMRELFTKDAEEALQGDELRDAIVEAVTDEYPDLAEPVKKWAKADVALEVLGATTSPVQAKEPINAFGQLAQATRGPTYDAVRKLRGDDFTPVTVSAEATPGAWKLRSKLDELSKRDTPMTIKDWDDIKGSIRGLKASARQAGNGSDGAAITDMETAISETLNGIIAREEFVGDPMVWKKYNLGIGQKGVVKDLKASRLKELMDESIPGSSLAKDFFRVTNPNEAKKASKLIHDLGKGLGEDSESLAALRSGILAETFLDQKPADILKRVDYLTSDPDIIALFPPDVADQLTELALNLKTIDTSNVTSGGQMADQVGQFLDSAARHLGGIKGQQIARTTGKLSGKMSVATGMAAGAVTGNPTIGVAAGVGAETLRQLAKKPVRRAIRDAGVQATTAVGRTAAQDEDVNQFVDQYVPDAEIIKNAMPQILEGAR